VPFETPDFLLASHVPDGMGGGCHPGASDFFEGAFNRDAVCFSLRPILSFGFFDPGLFAGLAGVDAAGNHRLQCPVFFPGFGQADRGVNADRKHVPFAVDCVFHPPPFRAVRIHQQVNPLASFIR